MKKCKKIYRKILFGFFLFIVVNGHAQDSMQSRVLKEVRVFDRKFSVERLKEIEGVHIFSGKKNEVIQLNGALANLSTNNVRQALSTVPGLSIWENDGSGIQISIAARGLSPNRSWEFNTRQNGYDISADIFGYPEAYYNPPLEAVDKIQIIRGEASLQFGPQFGGVINYVLKREMEKPFSFESQTTVGSYGMFSSFNAIGGNTKHWNYYAYHQYRKGDGWRDNGQYEIRNTHLFGQYKWNEKLNLSFEYTNMNDLIQQSGGLTTNQFNDNPKQSNRKRNWMATPWQLMNMHLTYRPNTRWHLDLSVFALLGERNSIGFLATPNFGDTINTLTNQLNARQIDKDAYKNIGLEWRALHHFGVTDKKHAFAMGIRLYQANTERNQKGKGDVGADYNLQLQAAQFPAAYTFKTSNAAFFAEFDLHFFKNFSLTPGFRLEYIRSEMNGRADIVNTVEQKVAPQMQERKLVLLGLGFGYKWKTIEMYGNVSTAYRPVLFGDLVPPSTTDQIDPSLKDASGLNVDVGWRGKWEQRLQFDLSLFFINYQNRIGLLRQFVDNDPAKNIFQLRTNLGSTQTFGVEAYVEYKLLRKVKHPFANLSVFSSLAFNQARYGEFVVSTVSGTQPNLLITKTNLKNNSVEYAPTYIIQLGVNYSYKDFSLAAQARFVSAVFSDANNTETANASGTVGKIDANQVIDLSMGYHLKNMLQLRAGLNNVLDTKYATRRSGGFPGPGLIPAEGRTMYLGIGLKL
jgi:Fe(3+) dicitrate transport protein